jgi:superfamily I DNA and/or RNA helicase
VVGFENVEKIEVSTIDEFQGKEKDYIIISPVNCL